MRQKIFFWAFFFSILTICLPASAETGWRITDFKSDIEIQSAGTVSVKETIAVFFDVEKHGIYRDIPVTYREKDGREIIERIKVFSITDQNAVAVPYRETEENGYLHLQIGNANRTITGAQTYVISYEVNGALRSFDTYDELYWNVTGNGWPVPVIRTSATITLPSPSIVQMSCYYGPSGATTQCTGEKISETQAFFARDALSSYEGMTIALGFSKGMATIVPPEEKKLFILSNEFLFFFPVFVLGIACAIFFRKRLGRDMRTETEAVPFSEHETIIAEYEAPLKLRPGEIGVLMDKRPDTLDITASIVNLAVRGHLTIQEIPKTWFLGTTDYRLSRTEKTDIDLLDYEKLLLASLFKSRKSFQISNIRNTFYKDLVEIKKSLSAELVNKGLMENDTRFRRALYIVPGAAVCLAGIFSGTTNNDILIGIFGGLFMPSVILLITFTAGVKKRTPSGHEAYLKAQGFKLFVSGTEKYRSPFYEDQNIFMEILPYAIVFGVTKKLAKAMQEMGVNPDSPTWYSGPNAFNAAVFATNIGQMSNSFSGAMASAPSGSGSGGGGSSGGGGGGGGGGSW